MDGLIKEFHVDKLHVSIYKTRRQMGMAASAHYLQRLEAILAGQPTARAVFAAAHSQDEFLAGLIEAEDAVFNRIEAFHMDEYIGLPADATAAFRHVPLPRDFRPETFPQGLSDGLRHRRRTSGVPPLQRTAPVRTAGHRIARNRGERTHRLQRPARSPLRRSRNGEDHHARRTVPATAGPRRRIRPIYRSFRTKR